MKKTKQLLSRLIKNAQAHNTYKLSDYTDKELKETMNKYCK